MTKENLKTNAEVRASGGAGFYVKTKSLFNKLITFPASLLCAVLFVSSAGEPLARADKVKLGKKVPPLELKDWSGKTYTLKSFKEPILAIWYEGKNSKEQNRWLKKKLKKMFDKKIIPRKKFRSVGIANFQETAIPNFLIARHIKNETKETGAIILCDREGDMMKKWGFRNGRSNIYLLDKNRRLRWRTSGALTKKRGNQLIRLIMRLTKD